jgi:hypothetical protein
MEINTSQAKERATKPKEGPESAKAMDERYYDRSDDLVARVRAARAAAQREMEAFGDPSEYDITIIHGQKKEDPAGSANLVSVDIVNARRGIEGAGRPEPPSGNPSQTVLAGDLTRQFGRGFGAVNLSQMRRFYMEWPPQQIFQTLSEKSLPLPELAAKFPLPWSAYVRLLSVKSPGARSFYETEALRSG